MVTAPLVRGSAYCTPADLNKAWKFPWLEEDLIRWNMDQLCMTKKIRKGDILHSIRIDTLDYRQRSLLCLLIDEWSSERIRRQCFHSGSSPRIVYARLGRFEPVVNKGSKFISVIERNGREKRATYEKFLIILRFLLREYFGVVAGVVGAV